MIYPAIIGYNAPFHTYWIDTFMQEFRKWQCIVCGFIYDEEEGLPEEGIEPGTRWDDVPIDWLCPDCGVGKEDFEMILIQEGAA